MPEPVVRSSRLDGKAAVVIGGGAVGTDPDLPGTGEASAILLARCGATVAVVGRSLENTRRTVERIVTEGGRAVAVLGDVTTTAGCESVVAEAMVGLGRLDIVVNNLGLAAGGSVEDCDDATWDDVIAVNLRAPIAVTRAAAPHLRAAGGGSVINIGSVAGLQASGSAAYGTTKAGLVGLTREMAASLGPDNVRVNCVVPGHLQTPFGDRGGEAMREMRRQISMLRREGTGWDVGWTVVFLASDEARFVTAATIPVDGGVTEQLTFATVVRLQAAGATSASASPLAGTTLE